MLAASSGFYECGFQNQDVSLKYFPPSFTMIYLFMLLEPQLLLFFFSTIIKKKSSFLFAGDIGCLLLFIIIEFFVVYWTNFRRI
jgi:NADH:ubiquinone oxidoreductase subunit 3 (subunit A)